MRTLNQAIADRKAEKAEAAERERIKRERERREQEAREQEAARLMREYVEEVYDVDLGDLAFEAFLVAGTFRISVKVPGGRVGLINSVGMGDGEVRIYEHLRRDRPMWRGVRRPGEYYKDYANFIDAVIFVTKGEVENGE